MSKVDYSTNPPTKPCSSKNSCLNPLQPHIPLTSDHYYKNKNRKCGHQQECKLCSAARCAAYRVKESKTVSEKRKRKYYTTQEWVTTRVYRRNNKVRASVWVAQFKERHPQYDADRMRTYRQNNPEQSKVTDITRKARKLNLPDSFTAKDWLYALEYFNNCCAVCGRCDMTLAADHWIPLSSPECPGTIPTNIVPLCHGKGGCNNEKHTTPAEVWLVWKLGELEAAKVLESVYQYLKSRG